MADENRLRRLAGWAAILAAVLAFGSTLLGLAAVNFNSADTYANPSSMLALGARGAALLRWSSIADMFGFYLLLMPLALYLGSWLRPSSPHLVTLYSVCGLCYALIGAIAAALMAAVLPPLIRTYATASPQQRESLQLIFDSFYRAGFQGLFNPLEMLVGATWWLGMAPLLRQERRALGTFTTVLGIAALLDALGVILQIEVVFMIGLAGVLLLIPLWALWCGVEVLKADGKPQ